MNWGHAKVLPPEEVTEEQANSWVEMISCFLACGEQKTLREHNPCLLTLGLHR